MTTCQIGPCGSHHKCNVPQVLVVPTLRVNRRYIDWPNEKWRWKQLVDVDIGIYDSNQVGMFIGVNVPEALMQLEVRKSTEGGLVCTRSPFGWTVMGEIPANIVKDSTNKCCFSTQGPENDDMLQQFWLHEAFGSKLEEKQFVTQLEEEALRILATTINYTGGRYEIGLPMEAPDFVLPNNRSSALRRLYANESRMRVDKRYAERYTAAIEAYETSRFSRKLKTWELAGPKGHTWYVPHFLVENPNKPDKPRLVFDGSSKHNGVCLNDALINGPLLLTNLHDLLILFREGPYAVSMDIEKMYLQVGVHKEDQPLFRYLWRRPENPGPPEAFQMLVEIFGAASSPTSCTFVLRRTAEDNLEYADVAEKVKANFYVDNYLDSFDDEDSAVRCCQRLTDLLKMGGFKLTHLMTSSRKIWQSFPQQRRAFPNLNIDLDDLPVERTLGLRWNGQDDTFNFQFTLLTLISTKRRILSTVSSIFDPLGFLACVTLLPKIILQEIWKVGKGPNETKIGWHEPLPSNIQQMWETFAKDLNQLENLRPISRSLRPIKYNVNHTDLQLHIFVDASLRGYSAVVYLRTKWNEDVPVALVTARARVAPVRQLTIPRLELLAAVMGYRMGIRVKKALKAKLSQIVWWTDSSIVLHWLNSQTTMYSQFVAYRREEVLEGSSVSQWRHVPGELNPADDGSRGVEAAKLHPQHRWFQGPAFLRDDEIRWPAGCGGPSDLEALEFVKPIFVGNISSPTTAGRHLVEVNTLAELKRKVASEECDQPTTEHLRIALEKCIREAQEEHFSREVDALKQVKPLPRDSTLLKLTPFLDDHGLLRVRGRLEHAILTEDAKHPIILPPTHRLTELIIKETHKNCFHSQTDRTLHEVRATYWIIKGRRTIRSVVKKCQECVRRLAVPVVPMMAPLPVDRLRPYLPPFTNVGVDYFGPLHIAIGRRVEKRYGCLFTCLVTRAIHIELASTLNTDSFLMAIRRFISRRGSPKVMYSYNGTNLVAGEQELRVGLQRLMQDNNFSNQLADRGISWHFSPPSAPHFGGVWERLVRSAKTALKIVLGNQTVSEEVLTTVMAEAESMLNGRPLTHLSVDPDDSSPLTPNHFLLGRSHPHISPDIIDESKGLSRRRWLAAQELAQHFWRRWLKEYVPSLIERSKWLQHRRNLKVGDLVLIVDHNTPRGQWPTGYVTKLLTSQSTKEKEPTVRTVVVRTEQGEYRRPVVKLCLLQKSKPEEGNCTTAGENVTDRISKRRENGGDVGGGRKK